MPHIPFFSPGPRWPSPVPYEPRDGENGRQRLHTRGIPSLPALRSPAPWRSTSTRTLPAAPRIRNALRWKFNPTVFSCSEGSGLGISGTILPTFCLLKCLESQPSVARLPGPATGTTPRLLRPQRCNPPRCRLILSDHQIIITRDRDCRGGRSEPAESGFVAPIIAVFASQAAVFLLRVLGARKHAYEFPALGNWKLDWR